MNPLFSGWDSGAVQLQPVYMAMFNMHLTTVKSTLDVLALLVSCEVITVYFILKTLVFLLSISMHLCSYCNSYVWCHSSSKKARGSSFGVEYWFYLPKLSFFGINWYKNKSSVNTTVMLFDLFSEDSHKPPKSERGFRKLFIYFKLLCRIFQWVQLTLYWHFHNPMSLILYTESNRIEVVVTCFPYQYLSVFN